MCVCDLQLALLGDSQVSDPLLTPVNRISCLCSFSLPWVLRTFSGPLLGVWRTFWIMWPVGMDSTIFDKSTSLQASHTHWCKPLPYTRCLKPSPAWCRTQLSYVVSDISKFIPSFSCAHCPPLLSARSAHLCHFVLVQTLLSSWSVVSFPFILIFKASFGDFPGF